MKNLLIIFLLLSKVIFSQELQATVTVNFEQLPSINKENLSSFQNTIEDYLNLTRFTNETWQNDKIKCTFNIFFLSSQDDRTYTAQVFIGSQRPIYKSLQNTQLISILDNSWSFQYEKNQALYFNPTLFSSLESILDYYAFLIIGMDNDSWEKMSGTPIFTKAMFIVNNSVGGKFTKGWEKGSGSFNRGDLMEDILNEKYRPFREAIADYHYGLDFIAINKKVGQEKMVSLIKTLDQIKSKIDVRSIFVKSFFDAKHGEIINHLADYEDLTIFRKLKVIDPPHLSKYDEVLNKK
ncbi:MAG: DUF4835 family protein [Ignavibacteria bacterium]|nr:DUF4835 family protein [Ignavibacteria bacterium]MDP3829805.1 DUF4835 family protein [Ignavibacteriaceae bacterium]